MNRGGATKVLTLTFVIVALGVYLKNDIWLNELTQDLMAFWLVYC
jgi:hypothetical protein